MRTALSLLAVLLLAGPAWGSEAYQIGPRDLLQITVYQQPELSQEIRVGEDGQVSLPLVGPVPAAGKSVEDFARELVQRYGEFLYAPQVSVFVKEFHGREVSVLGEVVRPGLYRLKDKATLLEAISQAGGLTRESGDRVIVLRPVREGEKRDTLRINVSARELFSPGGTETANIELRDGDTVHVPGEFQGREISVLGEVVRPGLYRLRDKTTLHEAISQAGGLTQESGDQVIVLRPAREAASGEPDAIVVSTKELFSPTGVKAANIELRDGDTVHVPKQLLGLEISVLGEVARPGVYRFKGKPTLLEVISQAGGLTHESGERVIVLRTPRDGTAREPEAILASVPQLFSPAGMKVANIELRDGDTVHVPRAEHFFVFGAVVRPGSYKLEKGATITVIKAISLAGGFTDRASPRGIKITREEGDQKNVIRATLHTEVRSQDIIVVPESFF